MKSLLSLIEEECGARKEESDPDESETIVARRARADITKYFKALQRINGECEGEEEFLPSGGSSCSNGPSEIFFSISLNLKSL